MLIGTSHPHTIPQYIQRQLRCLTFHYKSPMKKAVCDILNERLPGKIVYKLDEKRDKVLAWGLLVWNVDCCWPEIMLYTRQSERGKGLAVDVFWALRQSIAEEADYMYYPHTVKAHDWYMKRFNERVQKRVPRPECLWVRQ